MAEQLLDQVREVAEGQIVCSPLQPVAPDGLKLTNMGEGL